MNSQEEVYRTCDYTAVLGTSTGRASADDIFRKALLARVSAWDLTVSSLAMQMRLET